MVYELKLTQYSGPLDKLLALIEERKLEVTEISLAKVTDDFLKYLSAIRGTHEDQALADELKSYSEEDMRVLADFIVVASRLLFIKSKALLPDLTLSEEEESDIKDLEARLKLYQLLKPAVKQLAELWNRHQSAVSRPYFMSTSLPNAQVFYPGNGVAPAALAASLRTVFAALEAQEMEREVVRTTIISLEDKIKSIVERVRTALTTSFRALAGESRSEIVVTFLALLHLAREQRIVLEQEGHLSDIIIKQK